MLDLDDFDAPDVGQSSGQDDLEVIDVSQNSEEWRLARRGIATASCFHQVIARGRADKPSAQRQKYMLTLLGERLTGQLAENASSPHFDRGHAMEADAADEYEFTQRVSIEPCGFMRRGDIGYSPDRIVTGARGLVEVKSKKPELQLAVLLADEMPAEHKPQVQGGLLVSGYDWCDFVSYWPGLPLFVKRVYRDEDYIAWLGEQIAAFNSELDRLEQQMIERYYGGVKAA